MGMFPLPHFTAETHSWGDKDCPPTMAPNLVDLIFLFYNRSPCLRTKVPAPASLQQQMGDPLQESQVHPACGFEGG